MHLVNIILAMAAFGIFIFLEALVINGIRSTTESEMIFEKPALWLKKKLGPFWSHPIVGCVKCSGLSYGGLMYWPLVTTQFGFHFWEVLLYIVNALILSVVSWYYYKKL